MLHIGVLLRSMRARIRYNKKAAAIYKKNK